MAQKVATVRKMKSHEKYMRQPPSADNKQQEFINTDTRRFKIQTGDMHPPPPPPPPPPAGPHLKENEETV